MYEVDILEGKCTFERETELSSYIMKTANLKQSKT